MNSNEKKYSALKRGERGAIISIAAYLFLTVIKLIVAHIAESTALKADGLNNSTDIIASIALLIGLRLSRKPPDADHPYGHWKSETLASLIASLIMFIVGIQVFCDAVSSLMRVRTSSPDPFAIYIALFSAAVMFAVAYYNTRLGKAINSQAVIAASKDNLSDAYVSIGTAIGIAGTFLHFYWLDAFTALIVALLICKTAWSIFYQATHQLTDGYDENKVALYTETLNHITDVKGVKDLKARWYGNNSVIDVTIFVDANLNIQKAHDIANHVEDILAKEHNIYKVTVHVEPDNLLDMSH